MARTNLEAFTDQQQELARWSKALGHPARVAIMETLAARGGQQCGEIVAELPLAQATVSQHLRALKDAELIEGTIDGPRSCYSINGQAFKRMAQYLGSWMHEQVCSPGCCC